MDAGALQLVSSPPSGVLVAHVGHWAVNLLYLGPVLLVVLVIAVGSRLGRTRRDDETGGG